MRAPAILISGAAFLIALGAACGAGAEPGPYYGFGLGYGYSQPFSSALPGAAFSPPGSLSLTVGRRYGRGAAFLGVEAGADVPLSGNTARNCRSGFPNRLFSCDHPAMLSLRSLVGADLLNAQYQLYGALSYAVTISDAAPDADSRGISGGLGGFTVGAGVQHQTKGGAIFRAEVVRERAGDARSRPANLAETSQEDISVTFSYIMNF